MKEISRESNKTKIEIFWRVRTAKAVHTYRFSGSKKTRGKGKTRTAKAVHAYRFSGSNLAKICYFLDLIDNLCICMMTN